MRDPGQPLLGLNVLEYGPGVSSAFAGWLLAELGASVSYLEKPDSGSAIVGQPAIEVSSFIRATSAKKRAVTAADLPQVLAQTSVVITALGLSSVRERLDDRVSLIAVSSPTRPEWEAFECIEDEMRLWARSGLASLSRTLTDSGRYGHISFPRNFQPSLLAGEAAALASISAAIRFNATGEAQTIELDKLELLTTLPMQPVATAQLEGRVVGEADGEAYPGGVMQALDGAVYVRPVEPTHWKRLLELVGDMDWASLEALSDRRFLLEARDLIDEPLRAWVANRTRENIVGAAQARHVPLAPLNRPDEVRSDRHLVAREFFGRGQARRGLAVPWLVHPERSADACSRKAGLPLRGDSGLPLAGLRILDLTWAWAGPFATTVLADLGAEVINIEWYPRASNMRTQPAFANGNENSHDASGWWSANQRGKLSVGVNLKEDAGTQIIRELASVSDAVVENFSPGVVDRLGIGYEELRRANPALVFVSMSAFGRSGPNSHFVGYGPHLFAAAGCAFALGDENAPSQMLIPYADPVSGMAGALAAIAYVYGARTSGITTSVDVSDLEATTLILADLLLEGEGIGEERPTPVLLHSADGQTIAVFARGAEDRTRCAAAVGAQDDSAGSMVEASWWRTANELALALDKERLAWSRVHNCSDVLRDPALLGADFWVDDQSPELARVNARIAAPFWRVQGKRPEVWCGAPPLFSDTRRVLDTLLGYTDSQIDALAHAGVIQEAGAHNRGEEAVGARTA